MIKIYTIKYDKPKKLKGKQSAFIDCCDDFKLVATIRKLKDRRWLADLKVWEVLSYKAVWVKKQHPEINFIEIGELLPELDPHAINTIYDIPEHITPPTPTQIEGFQYGLNRKMFILGDLMGCLCGDLKIKSNQNGRTKYSTVYELVRDFERTRKRRRVSWEDLNFRIESWNGNDKFLNKIKDVFYRGQKEVYKVTLKNSAWTIVTLDHKLLTPNGYLEVQEIKDLPVLTTDGYSPIVSIDRVGYSDTYDFEMEEPYSNYLVNQIVHHNCGKTYTVLLMAEWLRKNTQYKHCLIICGVNSVKYNWRNEVQMHLGHTATVLGSRKRKNGVEYTKSTEAKIEDLNNASDYYLITNIESMRSKEFVTEVIKKIKAGEIGLVAVDEAHKIKSTSASQTKGLLKAKPEYRIPMSGTPLIKSPLDLYPLLSWIEAETSNFTSFKNYYCVFGGYGGYNIIQYKHLEELQQQLDENMIRRTTTGLDVDLTLKREYIELTDNQRKVYNEVKQQVLDNIDKIKLSPNPMAMFFRLRQVTGDTSLVSSTIKESAKIDRCADIIEEVVANGQKVVLLSNWEAVTSNLKQYFKKYNPAYYTGVNKDREQQLERFKADENCSLIIGTIGALGTGHNLTQANTLIMFDSPFTDAIFMQCAKRIHRLGTTMPATVIDLIAKDTVDERVIEIRDITKNLSDKIVDNVAMTNENMLDILIK